MELFLKLQDLVSSVRCSLSLRFHAHRVLAYRWKHKENEKKLVFCWIFLKTVSKNSLIFQDVTYVEKVIKNFLILRVFHKLKNLEKRIFPDR